MIVLPSVSRLEVSVVMVTYGGGDWALRALAALVQNTPPVYQVIVVDNASPDGTGERLREEVRGATLIRNDSNEGFGPAANQGAARATARAICFLNPDALVEPGWLEPLLDTLGSDERIGAAAPRLLDLDGTLQEAGSAIGREGATLAIGRGADPADPEHRFRRTVDFASAACLLVRRTAFEAAGGFDPAYAPAYGEDADLCLRMRRAGYSTVYEPRSTVRHARGASSERAEAERLIRRNRSHLWRTWWRELSVRPWLEDAELYPAREVHSRDWDVPDRILIFATAVPPANTAEGRLLLEAADLYRHARVTLAAQGAEAAEEQSELLLERGVEIALGPRDWDEWLDRRRFHATAVVFLDAEARERFAALVGRSQPQARSLEPNELAPVLRTSAEGGALRAALVGALAGLGVTPPSGPARAWPGP